MMFIMSSFMIEILGDFLLGGISMSMVQIWSVSKWELVVSRWVFASIIE